MIVELIEDSRVSPNVAQRADVVWQHCSTALANAMEHQNLFLMPVWRALGKTSIMFRPARCRRPLGVAAGVLLLTLILCLWPAQLTMESKGALEPVQRQDVFAGIDGKVEELYGRPRRSRHQGPTAVEARRQQRLRSGQREQIEGEGSGHHRALERGAAEWLDESEKLTLEERNRLAGEQAELEQKVEALRHRAGAPSAKRRRNWTSAARSTAWWSPSTSGTG